MSYEGGVNFEACEIVRETQIVMQFYTVSSVRDNENLLIDDKFIQQIAKVDALDLLQFGIFSKQGG